MGNIFELNWKTVKSVNQTVYSMVKNNIKKKNLNYWPYRLYWPYTFTAWPCHKIYIATSEFFWWSNLPFVLDARWVILVVFVLLFGLLLGLWIRLGSVEWGILMNQCYMKPTTVGSNNKIREVWHTIMIKISKLKFEF